MKLLLAECFGILFSQIQDMLKISDCDVGGCACASMYVCACVCPHVCAVGPVSCPRGQQQDSPDPPQASSRPAASSCVSSPGFAFLHFTEYLSCEQPASHRMTPSQTDTFVFCRYRTPWTNFLEEFSICFQVLQWGCKGEEQLGETNPNTALQQDKIRRILKGGEEKTHHHRCLCCLFSARSLPAPH